MIFFNLQVTLAALFLLGSQVNLEFQVLLFFLVDQADLVVPLFLFLLGVQILQGHQEVQAALIPLLDQILQLVQEDQSHQVVQYFQVGHSLLEHLFHLVVHEFHLSQEVQEIQILRLVLLVLLVHLGQVDLQAQEVQADLYLLLVQ